MNLVKPSTAIRSQAGKFGASGNLVPRWLSPPTGHMKMNVDAAVAKQEARGAIAAVCRNSEGVYSGASALTLPGIEIGRAHV